MEQRRKLVLAVVLAVVTATLGTIAGASTANEAVTANQCGRECELQIFCEDNVGEQTMCAGPDDGFSGCKTKKCEPNES